MELNLELNAAEGGDDAVLLLVDQASILQKFIAKAGGTSRIIARTKG